MKQRTKYSKEFKFRAIEMSNSSDCIKDLAIGLGINEALSKTMHAKSTIILAWQMANMSRPIQDSLIFHSDRGIQYACKEFVNHLKRNVNVERSMSRKGNCWDNAVAEVFFQEFENRMGLSSSLFNKARGGVLHF